MNFIIQSTIHTPMIQIVSPNKSTNCINVNQIIFIKILILRKVFITQPPNMQTITIHPKPFNYLLIIRSRDSNNISKHFTFHIQMRRIYRKICNTPFTIHDINRSRNSRRRILIQIFNHI